jgi:competence protein ComEC
MIKRPDNISLFAFMCAGVYCAYMVNYRPVPALSVFTLFIVFLGIKKLRLFTVLFFTGAVLFLISNYNYLKSDKNADVLDGREIIVYGKIVSSQDYGRSSYAVIRTDSVGIGSLTSDAGLSISAFINASELFKNDKITLKGRFTLPGETTNLYQRDLRPYYLTKNISGQLEKVLVISVERTENFGRKIYSIQKRIIEVFDRRLSYRAGNFLSAVMIGRRDRLDKSVIKDFAGSGAIHLLAVSGLHVGFLVVILSLLSSMISLRGWPKIIISSSVLFSYAVFTGGSSSVIRAVLMAVILMLSYPMNRKVRFIDIIGTAGIISLIYDPNQIFGAGFILSFGAAASIAVIYGPVSAWFNKLFSVENPFLKKAADGIILSLSITVGLMPFILYMFGRYNIVSIFSNVLLIPLTALTFMSGMILLAVDKIDILAMFVADVINLCVYFINSVVSFTNSIEVLVLKYKPDLLMSVMLVTLTVMIFYLKNYKIKTAVSLTLAGILIYKLITIKENSASLYEFHTKFNDTVLLEDCGRSVLVAGKLSKSEINNIIKPYLLNRNINELDYLVSFHEWYETESLISGLDIPVRFLATSEDIQAFSGYSEHINLKYSENTISIGNTRLRFHPKDQNILKSAENVTVIELKNERIKGKMTEIR